MKLFSRNLFFALVTSFLLLSAASAVQVVQDETIVSNGGSGNAVSCPNGYTLVYSFENGLNKFAHCVKKVDFAQNGEYVINSFVGTPTLGNCPNGTKISGSPFTDSNSAQLALCTSKLTVSSLDSGSVVDESRIKKKSDGCTGGYKQTNVFTVGTQELVHCVRFTASAGDNPSCQITGLKWVDKSGQEVTEVAGWDEGSGRADGEEVYLWATASAECQQGVLNFRFKISSVSEGLAIADTYLTGVYEASNGRVLAKWDKPKWARASSILSSNDNNEPVEYIFTAFVNNNRRTDSPHLTVTRPGNPECDEDSDCEEGEMCSGKRCVAECSTNAECEEKYPGEKEYCEESACVECNSDSQCADGETCSEEGRCFDPQEECSLENALWLRMNSEGAFSPVEGGPFRGWIEPTDPNAAKYKNGDSLSVSSQVRGPPACRDKVTFTVYEDDFISDDFVGTVQGSRSIKWQLFKAYWDSVSIGFFEGEELEYKFVAEITNDEGDVTDSKESSTITVTSPALADCSEDEDCSDGNICNEGGECVAECSDNDDCSGGDVCFGNVCVECFINDDDGMIGTCNAGLPACSSDNECVACLQDSDCGANQMCNSNNTCVKSNVSSCLITELSWIDSDTDEIVSRKIIGSTTSSRSHSNRGELVAWKDGFDAEVAGSGEVVLVAKVADYTLDTITNGCTDQKVNFEIFEVEPGEDESQEASTAMPINQEEKASYYDWGSFDWFEDSRGKNPEYYFNAWIEGFEEQKVTSNTLEAMEPTCSNDNDCAEDFACKEGDCVEDKRCTGTITGIKYGLCESDDDCFTLFGAQKCKG